MILLLPPPHLSSPAVEMFALEENPDALPKRRALDDLDRRAGAEDGITENLMSAAPAC